MPSSRSGELRWKKLRACDWINCPKLMTRRNIAAAPGIATAIRSSHALAEASRWLIGQMPQVRAVSDGIS